MQTLPIPADGQTVSFQTHFELPCEQLISSTQFTSTCPRHEILRGDTIIRLASFSRSHDITHLYRNMTMMPRKYQSFLLFVVGCLAVTCSTGQQYDQDYPEYQEYADNGAQDNLYADYAAHQQDKQGGGGGGMGKVVLGSAVSWFLGAKFHSGRTAKKLKSKFQKEQKELYTQYYNDVYKLSEQNTELQYMVEQLKVALHQTEEKHELEALQRDYDEFKMPDVDGDDRISRAEFNMYVKNYLASYPGLAEKDYPKFEDFDHDGDGFVSFQEYAQQMALQAQQAELEQLYGSSSSGGGGGGSGGGKKAQSLQDLYGETKKAGNFNDLYANYR